MKAVIFAGGLGTRLSEETSVRPKPMVEIGGRPILWHIMKLYSTHGITEFVICAGYKGYVIKEYFANYFLHSCDVRFDLAREKIKVINRRSEDWIVDVVDTGEEANTGGRLLAVKQFLGDDASFCLTYGDGVGNIDITRLIKFHETHGCAATLTAAAPSGRFGALDLNDTIVTEFREKPQGDGSYINAGFFVLNASVFQYLSSPTSVWETDGLGHLAQNGQLRAFKHEGFWHPMDTLRDKIILQEHWDSGNAPWKIW